jgi:hypothetical protein
MGRGAWENWTEIDTGRSADGTKDVGMMCVLIGCL